MIALVCALAFALPFGWENTLAGFQSAFYFLVLFSVLSIWLTVDNGPGTGPWLVGWLCAFCALLTSAGGLLTPVVLALIPLVRLAFDPGRWRDAAINTAVAAAPHPRSRSRHRRSRITNLSGGHARRIRDGARPQSRVAVGRASSLDLVMWAPFAALVATLGRRLQRPTRSEELIGVLAVWGIPPGGGPRACEGSGWAGACIPIHGRAESRLRRKRDVAHRSSGSRAGAQVRKAAYARHDDRLVRRRDARPRGYPPRR